ncbi:tetratricopeptide repeat protein [Acetobacter sp. DmW_136]|uniref:tetratricopeptide repeat protein n=1 Tax=Acetobacter sp. DmW_136 TaxID=2591091 RepID=UPI001EE2F539|nr:tetratricopeptide repeat protein [Acetobacter sp. DmW_136]
MYFRKFWRYGKRKKDVSKPVELPSEIEAIRQKALRGYHLEQVLWGKILLDSVYLPSDPEMAVIWFRMAAQAGYGPAHNMLGRCYYFGWGCTQSHQKAITHYTLAAKLHDNWGRYNLAIMTMRGIGMPQDLPSAFALFQEGAQAGHAKSMNILARFYEEGWVISRDKKKAITLYKQSAQKGDYRGQHNYAVWLAEQGHIEEAMLWWQQAVPQATLDVLLAIQDITQHLQHSSIYNLKNMIEKRIRSNKNNN